MTMKPESSLLVTLRVRPMNDAEFKAGAKVIAHTVDSNLVVLLDPTADPDDVLRANRSRERQFVFDCAFDQMATQRDVYEATIKDLLADVLSGYNVTVFAYGPTGAGKTYTMLGTPSDPGIMALALQDLFRLMSDTQDDVNYQVSMSYMEIYNEMIRDLLDPSRGILELREDANGDTVVSGLSEMRAFSPSQLMNLLHQGNQCRTCEPTAANKTSSRSHAILKVTIRSHSNIVNVTQEIHTGCLFLVDLAGSERASVTKNRGKRMVEGAHINRSLLALGNVINALATGQGKVPYVNFRDSKLTRILKESLGGNTKTVMISHISPASTAFEESRNTLTYAERSRSIKTKVHQNIHEAQYHVIQYQELIAQLRTKIAELQKKLECCTCKCFNKTGERNGEDLCLRMQTIFAEQKELLEAISALKYSLVQNAIETQKQLSIISEWKLKGNTCTTTTFPATLSTDLETKPSIETIPKESSDHGSILDINQISCTTTTDEDDIQHVEPIEVSQAREELATLVGEKQRMEARQKRLEKRLAISDSQLSELQKELNELGMMPLHQQQYLQTISTQHTLHCSAVNSELAATLASIKLEEQEKTMEELKRHNLLLLELIQRQQELLKEHDVPIPPILNQQLIELQIKQKLLSAQIEANRQMLTKALFEQSGLVRYSACTNFSLAQGSKSNFLQEDEEEEEMEEDEKKQNKTSYSQLPQIITSTPLVRTGWTNSSSALLQPPANITKTEVSPSLPFLSSPERYKSLKSKPLSRTFNSLPTVHNPDDQHSHQPFLNKVALTRVSVSRSSSHRRMKYLVQKTKLKEDSNLLDVESIKTSSMSSLSTCMIKSPSHVLTKKTKQQPTQISMPSLKSNNKLSQTTQKKLKETRTALTANEFVIKSVHSTPSRKALAQPTPKKAKANSIHSTPKRFSYLPPNNNNRTKPAKPVSNKVTTGGNFTSPYLSSVPVRPRIQKKNKKQLQSTTNNQ